MILSTDVGDLRFAEVDEWPDDLGLGQEMMGVADVHRREPFDARSAEEIEECGFDAIGQIVSEDDVIDLVFFDQFC